MVSRQKAIPYRLPSSPNDYEQSYFNQLVRQIEKGLNELSHPSLAKCDQLFIDINTLPSTGAGLRPGFVFRDGSILKIVKEGDVYIDTYFITVALGTITVTTT